MAFASGNTGRLEFQRDPNDRSEGLDIQLTHFNVVRWKLVEDVAEFRSITPYPKVALFPNDLVRAPGRILWEATVTYLLRTNIAIAGLSDFPARFKLWHTIDGGLGINYRQGFGYVTNIVTEGDRRGAVQCTGLIKSATGGLEKSP